MSFTYPDTGIQALKDVSFNVKPGQRLAIIGRTGAGKTTIADLIMRMYDASSGHIYVDDTDIKQLKLSSLRAQIGFVPQDVFLFSETITENISFGLDKADKETAKLYAGVHIHRQWRLKVLRRVTKPWWAKEVLLSPADKSSGFQLPEP